MALIPTWGRFAKKIYEAQLRRRWRGSAAKLLALGMNCLGGSAKRSRNRKSERQSSTPRHRGEAAADCARCWSGSAAMCQQRCTGRRGIGKRAMARRLDAVTVDDLVQGCADRTMYVAAKPVRGRGSLLRDIATFLEIDPDKTRGNNYNRAIRLSNARACAARRRR